ncbi:LysR family transcriptional regulator [Actinocorallia sp. API 0066]|uniref:LysR family transcriptional regulator n=1 Tax=Actinocorallia sp. API 0066 TaxID=2896846 RepID=UPI001E5AB0A8|nr:LysR family transcriptional regulator [Actinocorallia sp. API 0066]MCD0451897.1 LysR family transcriptional regulator [Actinocorallia sp. API 0066]
MTESRLRTFVALAETGSVRAAAERLFVTESAVSASVTALARELGVPLLARAGRGVALTPAGRVYAEYARRLLGLHAEARAAARGEHDPATGRLRLAAVTTAADQVLPALLAGFRRAWPHVDLALKVGPSRRVWASLAAHEADLVLAGRPPSGAETKVLATRANDLIVVIAPDVPFDLFATPWVLREPGSGTRATADAYLAEHDATPPTLVLGSNGAVIAGAAAGLGAALVHREAVQRELTEGALVIADAPGTPLHRPWHAVSGPHPSAPTRLFVEHLTTSHWTPAP